MNMEPTAPPLHTEDAATAWMAEATAASTPRRRSSRATASASTRPARSAPPARSTSRASSTPSSTASTTACGAAAASASGAASSSAAGRRRSTVAADDLTAARRAAGTGRGAGPARREPTRSAVRARRWRRRRGSRRCGRAACGLGLGGLLAGGGQRRRAPPASSVVRLLRLPSASPSLNSFCALPRFFASFGSCEPPKITSTTTRTMIHSGPEGMARSVTTHVWRGGGHPILESALAGSRRRLLRAAAGGRARVPQPASR